MTEPLAVRLISHLDERMKERGYTGRRLAKDANTTEVSITKLRRNTFSMLDSSVVARVCTVLGITPGDLLSISDPQD